MHPDRFYTYHSDVDDFKKLVIDTPEVLEEMLQSYIQEIEPTVQIPRFSINILDKDEALLLELHFRAPSYGHLHLFKEYLEHTNSEKFDIKKFYEDSWKAPLIENIYVHEKIRGLGIFNICKKVTFNMERTKYIIISNVVNDTFAKYLEENSVSAGALDPISYPCFLIGENSL